jgi:erythritol transport system ATP-binding protein
VNELVLESRAVSKQYPGTLALDQVNFQLRRGRVTALIGENGAGKSTLVKILAGIEAPTRGTLALDGREVAFASVRDADRAGIGMIHQELNLCPNLSVADNIFLARHVTTRGMVDRKEQDRRAAELLGRLEHHIAPGALVGDLPLGQQQVVEIAKALARDVRVLMMDEPTSALSNVEIEVLFRIIRDLAAHGVAIVYISHRLHELLEIADFVSVLRDGRMVAEAPAAEIDARWIVERMTGRSASAETIAGGPPAEGREVLSVASLSLTAASGRRVLRDVSFTLRAGEVLGIYGLMGAGRTELLESLMGLHPDAAGSMQLEGRRLDGRSTAARIGAGLAMVPEDRQAAGLVQPLSIRSNMTLAALKRVCRWGWLSPGREHEFAAPKVAELQIKAPGLGCNIGALSGGNQQKVVIAKCLLTGPRVLLLDEPTRGVDVGAKAEIHSLVRRLAGSGIGVVLVSSELEEVRAVADRILVMSRGAVTANFDSVHAGDDELAAAASAHPEQAPW